MNRTKYMLKCLLNFRHFETSLISWSERSLHQRATVSRTARRRIKNDQIRCFEERHILQVFFFLIYNDQVWSLIYCKKRVQCFVSVTIILFGSGRYDTRWRVRAWLKSLFGFMGFLEGFIRDIIFFCLCNIILFYISL